MADQIYFISIGNNSFIQPLKIGSNYLNKVDDNYFFYNWQKAIFMNDEKSKIQIEYYLKQLNVRSANPHK